jgi:hypothetical protein
MIQIFKSRAFKRKVHRLCLGRKGVVFRLFGKTFISATLEVPLTLARG